MRASKNGMTLLELLVALALLAAISTALLSTTTLGIRTLERAEVVMDQDTAPAVRLQLRRWLRSAAPPALLSNVETRFTGTSDGFVFNTVRPAGYAPDAASFRVTVSRNQDALFVDIDAVDDNDQIISALRRRLADNVEDVTFSYLRSGVDGPSWEPTWGFEFEIPKAVRIEAENSPSWPPFLVRLAHSGN